MINEKLKFGIIGFGKIGRLRKELIEKLNIGIVEAIADPFAEFSDLKGDYFLTRDYHDLLNRKLDCLVIATPNNITAKAVMEGLSAGKHIFCEKPPGRNLDDVLMIQKCFNNCNGLKLKFGFNHRAHNSVIEAKRIIRSGRMGKLMWGRGLYGKSGGLNFKDEWRSKVDISGGGILLDQGIHMLDLLNLFFEGFSEVKSFITNSFWEIPVEDNAFILLKNDKNQFASFHSSSTQWKHTFKLELFFSDGYMILSGLLTGSRSYGRETLIVARRQFEDELELVGNPSEEVIYFDEDKSWELELKDFEECIKENKPVIHGSIENAVKVMELIDRIYKSDNTWKNENNLSHYKILS
ncbi:MAG: Gfo/Idh/MocA family oxidoreductase [Ignavibacteriales bacterium]|nr:Gfo/Idh/MocA family oxidoreductase [Ignavibacteriales bacterium]